MIVKAGDSYATQWIVNADLTGSTVRLLAHPSSGDVIELPSTVIDAPGGVIEHVLSGALPVGTYRVVAEVTQGDTEVTYPTGQEGEPQFETLVVTPKYGVSSDICYPETDWSCRFSDAELIAKREDPATGPLIEKAEAFAWSTLAALTAYRIGTCPVTVRPCAARCLSEPRYLTSVVRNASSWLAAPRIGGPFISGGNWYNACGCRSANDCGCERLSEVVLPGPVGSIVSVEIDGETVPRASYRVDNGSVLVRLDGETWPTCQDMAGDGFQVTYYRGAAPNLMTKAAAGALAVEFYAACADEPCKLPWNLTSMARNGESYEMGEGGIDGVVEAIPEVAAVVRIYNPYGLKSQPFVASPDAYSARTPTWT